MELHHNCPESFHALGTQQPMRRCQICTQESFGFCLSFVSVLCYADVLWCLFLLPAIPIRLI